MTFQALVVDDDRETQKLIGEILASAGATVRAAYASGEARVVLEASRFDVILMKTNLADLTGVRITGALRTGGGPNVGVPVIGLTTGATDAHIRDCWRSGMNALLPKPLVRRRLLETIRALGFGAQASADTAASLAVFSALSNETRLQLFTAIARHRPVTATGLAEEGTITRQLAQFHINQLRKAGLIKAHPRGREMLFEAQTEGLEAAAQWMLDLADQSAASQ
jgi:CheY-like chemotaxis protein/DNA-binding transcriptional ArsR family regulator